MLLYISECFQEWQNLWRIISRITPRIIPTNHTRHQANHTPNHTSETYLRTHTSHSTRFPDTRILRNSLHHTKGSFFKDSTIQIGTASPPPWFCRWFSLFRGIEVDTQWDPQGRRTQCGHCCKSSTKSWLRGGPWVLEGFISFEPRVPVVRLIQHGWNFLNDVWGICWIVCWGGWLIWPFF